MQRDTLDPMLTTFMYFLHTQDSGDDALSPELFNDKWSNIFYEFDDMAEGKFYE